MSLLNEYNRFADLTYENLCDYGHKYTIWDYMDLQRAVIQAHEAVTNGDLEVGLRILETKFREIEDNVLQDIYNEEAENDG